MSIFGKTPVTNLGESKNTLDDTKHTLNFYSDSRYVPIAQPLSIRQRFIPAAFSLGKVFGFRRSGLNGFTLSRIGRITPDASFIAMQQIFKHLGVMNIGGHSRHRVDDFGFAVYANMGFHTKIPLITFLGLMHLRIALLVLVLGRTRRIDDAGIHNGAIGHLYPLRLKVFSDDPKQLITQFGFLKQVTEIENRRFIRNRLAPKVYAGKAAHEARFIKRLFVPPASNITNRSPSVTK
jgi:hypothetical protein